MGYLPIFLDVTTRPCLVVGGGGVAQRKVESLLEAGASVTVVSPSLTPELERYLRQGTIRHLARPYAEGDMTGAALVYCATGDPALGRALHAEALGLGIPINVADLPELCTFIVPAVVHRGRLGIAVSTSGTSPAMAKRIRRRLERLFGPEYGLALEVLGAARQRLRETEPDAGERARRLGALALSGLAQYLRRGEFEAADRLVQRHAGTGLAELGIATELLSRGHGSVDPANMDR